LKQFGFLCCCLIERFEEHPRTLFQKQMLMHRTIRNGMDLFQFDGWKYFKFNKYGDCSPCLAVGSSSSASYSVHGISRYVRLPISKLKQQQEGANKKDNKNNFLKHSIAYSLTVNHNELLCNILRCLTYTALLFYLLQIESPCEGDRFIPIFRLPKMASLLCSAWPTQPLVHHSRPLAW